MGENQESITEPLTYEIIERGIRLALRKQDALTDDFASAGDALASAEINYKKAWAITRRSYRGSDDPTTGRRYTQDALEDVATEETIEEFAKYLNAKAAHDAARQALLSIRTRLEGLRSLMASHRALTE